MGSKKFNLCLKNDPICRAWLNVFNWTLKTSLFNPCILQLLVKTPGSKSPTPVQARRDISAVNPAKNVTSGFQASKRLWCWMKTDGEQTTAWNWMFWKSKDWEIKRNITWKFSLMTNSMLEHHPRKSLMLVACGANPLVLQICPLIRRKSHFWFTKTKMVNNHTTVEKSPKNQLVALKSPWHPSLQGIKLFVILGIFFYYWAK